MNGIQMGGSGKWRADYNGICIAVGHCPKSVPLDECGAVINRQLKAMAEGRKPNWEQVIIKAGRFYPFTVADDVLELLYRQSPILAQINTERANNLRRLSQQAESLGVSVASSDVEGITKEIAEARIISELSPVFAFHGWGNPKIGAEFVTLSKGGKEIEVYTRKIQWYSEGWKSARWSDEYELDQILTEVV